MNLFTRRVLTAIGTLFALLGASAAAHGVTPPRAPNAGAQRALTQEVAAQENTGSALSAALKKTETQELTASASVAALQETLSVAQQKALIQQASATTPVVHAVSGASGGGDDGSGGGDD